MARKLIGSDNSVIKESRHWINKNKGLKLDPEEAFYYSPRISSEIMDCSMPMTFDHYSCCSLGCTYCFAFYFKTNNPNARDTPLRSANIDGLIRSLNGDPQGPRQRLLYKHFYQHKFLLHWGGMSDPFCNFEHTNKKGLELIKALGDLNYPTLFSFKGRTIMEDPYMNVFAQFANQRNFAFQVSMVTGDDKLASMLEIGVPSPTRRLRIIKTLSDMGYWTILRLRPFIVGITDHGLDDLLHAALDAGIRGISTEFFVLDCRTNQGMKSRYDWLSKLVGVDDLTQYYKDLSPHERGVYMRLNRLVKEPHMRKIYEFCLRHNLTLGVSDPDFKELCTSGSCCAMPDFYPDNPVLQNWTTNQLTFHVKELRKHYHLTGECGTMLFNTVYGSDATYLDDYAVTVDHIAVTTMCAADRRARTFRTIIQEHWNNLRSPSNPRNYLHGKVMPVGLDDERNLIYQYNPSDYETRWTQEGVSLSL